MIQWHKVKKILVVKLRSIGDTVLATPSLFALRRFLPNAKIDILLESRIAPILEGFNCIDEIITVDGDSLISKLKIGLKINRSNYDVAFNLHGGTTATFFVAASGAKYRVGYKELQYSFLYNYLLSSASDFWKRSQTHSAEQQLALLGFVGVPVDDRPRSFLAIKQQARDSLFDKLSRINQFSLDKKIVLIHPSATLETKRWAIENFAQLAEFFYEIGLQTVSVGSENEKNLINRLVDICRVPIVATVELTLPEVVALAKEATIFVGNDSGIAHIAAAVQTPLVVIFGSSNVNHWRPWTDAPYQIVHKKMPCQPCHGYFCEEFDKPRCILEIGVSQVIEAVKEVLLKAYGKLDFSREN
jgi:lipopolysaccharide heptosyltransferase II